MFFFAATRESQVMDSFKCDPREGSGTRTYALISTLTGTYKGNVLGSHGFEHTSGFSMKAPDPMVIR